ncbi:ribonuclease domain-containing protein [Caldimonas tepidiphila]|uniref:ribonuclease domain-containing protein n=1 Tax=Caldimonas tepidiphila TaxID=2315841 RepID=UPI000E5AC43F|nr:ribonuclease [Caldimonas tepidiphila]
MGVAAIAVAALALAPATGLARSHSEQAPADSQVVNLAELPRQAKDTHRLILSGGPFPYDKDGTVFGNRERLLPAKKRGYYREYTVKTPGGRDRGARRIVCGGPQATTPEACYYTDDHYASFRRIVD